MAVFARLKRTKILSKNDKRKLKRFKKYFTLGSSCKDPNKLLKAKDNNKERNYETIDNLEKVVEIELNALNIEGSTKKLSVKKLIKVFKMKKKLDQGLFAGDLSSISQELARRETLMKHQTRLAELKKNIQIQKSVLKVLSSEKADEKASMRQQMEDTQFALRGDFLGGSVNQPASSESCGGSIAGRGELLTCGDVESNPGPGR